MAAGSGLRETLLLLDGIEGRYALVYPQSAQYTFEGMDDVHGESGFAGFSLWRHEFIESRWFDVPPRSAGLWIRTQKR